jgi:cytochrome oxidase Cu insertion factor (SCO1/SenC/PrrC family)
MAVLALAGCGTAGTAGAQGAAGNPGVDPGTSLGGTPAPGFTLDNQFGQPMSLRQFRGKVVLLGFEDSRCTTVCPLTTQEMLLAKQLLGPAGSQVQLLGVDANPVATAVSDVMAYSRAHGLVNQWDFLTGPKARLAAVWKEYHIYAAAVHGQVDHEPALFVIDQRGRERELYLTAVVYASIWQQAQVLAGEISRLLPGHPRVARQVPLAAVSGLRPSRTVTLPAAWPPGGRVVLGPQRPHLVVFFATWLSELADLRADLTGLNGYVRAARREHLPGLTAVDETVTEPSPGAALVRRYLSHLGQRPSYPVALDTTGRLADGYGVQDQPWYVLTWDGLPVWTHDGAGSWLSPAALIRAVRRAAGKAQGSQGTG